MKNLKILILAGLTLSSLFNVTAYAFGPKTKQQPAPFTMDFKNLDQILALAPLNKEDAKKRIAKDFGGSDEPKSFSFFTPDLNFLFPSQEIAIKWAQSQGTKPEQLLTMSYIALDDSAPGSVLCTKGNIYYLNTAEQSPLVLSPILPKNILEASLFPKSPVANRPLSIADVIAHMSKILDVKNNTLSTEAERQQLVQAAIITALRDAQIAMLNAKFSKVEEALNIVKNVCSDTNLQKSQLKYLTSAASGIPNSLEDGQKVVTAAAEEGVSPGDITKPAASTQPSDGEQQTNIEDQLYNTSKQIFKVDLRRFSAVLQISQQSLVAVLLDNDGSGLDPQTHLARKYVLFPPRQGPNCSKEFSLFLDLSASHPNIFGFIFASNQVNPSGKTMSEILGSTSLTPEQALQTSQNTIEALEKAKQLGMAQLSPDEAAQAEAQMIYQLMFSLYQGIQAQNVEAINGIASLLQPICSSVEAQQTVVDAMKRQEATAQGRGQGQGG